MKISHCPASNQRLLAIPKKQENTTCKEKKNQLTETVLELTPQLE